MKTQITFIESSIYLKKVEYVEYKTKQRPNQTLRKQKQNKKKGKNYLGTLTILLFKFYIYLFIFKVTGEKRALSNNNNFDFVYHICQGSQDRSGDFHWYRRDGVEKWSHKPGQARPTFKDNDNNDVKDPRKANMGSYKIVAFMESCKDTVNIKNNDVCL